MGMEYLDEHETHLAQVDPNVPIGTCSLQAGIRVRSSRLGDLQIGAGHCGARVRDRSTRAGIKGLETGARNGWINDGIG